jgi:hypothetical protein
MAKAKSKETSVPLIFALVFFILTTIAFGVMWYLAYSDQEKYIADAKKAKEELTKPRSEAREAELKNRVYRIWMGIPETEDLSTIEAEKGQGATVANELTKINEAVAKKLSVPDAASLPKEFQYWRTDSNRKAGVPGEKLDTGETPLPLLDQVARLNKLDVAYKAAEDEREAYKKQITGMQAAIAGLDTVKKKFQAEIDRLPADFKNELKKVIDGFDARTDLYKKAEAAARKKIEDLTDERDKLQTVLRKRDELIANLQADNQLLQLKTQKETRETFTYDEPQGKILRKLPEGVVELNIGSAVGVKAGLTFTVLPPDYPEKGRQSRMRMLRQPDGRGGYKSVETFVPKGSVEVYEVVGPNLSLARIQSGSELDPIRDGVTVGDLLYNSVWRKGVADHVALIGIFDINGDGADDIESVVRELTKMGIPVDAYFDLKKRQWVGQVTERTRYLVEGYMPINSATDPLRDEKTKLLGVINDAVKEAKQKGVDAINFRDFFSRMGYKFRLDVSDDRINQATAPYLSNVGVGNSPVPPPPAP